MRAGKNDRKANDRKQVWWLNPFFGTYLVPEMTNNRKGKDKQKFATKGSNEQSQADRPTHIVPKRTKLNQYKNSK